MVELKLEKFTKTYTRLEDRISITLNMAFGLPTFFFNSNNINRYKYVVLYFDKINKVIGLCFTNDTNEKHKFSLVKSKEGYGANVMATSFFKTYKIDTKKFKGKYNWKKKKIEGIGQVFLIDLKQKEDKEDKET